MKKVMAILVVASIAGLAVADISVNLSNPGAVFTTDGGGTVGVDQALVQLVWNASAPVAVDQTLQASGDIIMATFSTASGFWGTWGANMGADDYTVSASGYLTVRVFDDANKGAGANYFQYVLDSSGTLTTFDAQNTATIYKTDFNASFGAEEEKITGGDFTVGNMQVIPEPATFGLMAIAGLGLFLARKKARR